MFICRISQGKGASYHLIFVIELWFVLNSLEKVATACVAVVAVWTAGTTPVPLPQVVANMSGILLRDLEGLAATATSGQEGLYNSLTLSG